MPSEYNNIEDLIRAHVTFLAESNSWNRLYCAVCGDGSRTKGPRGGWLFQDEGCFYHCFNCNINANFDPSRQCPWSKEMRKVFDAFGIPKKLVGNLILAKKGAPIAPEKPKRKPSPITPLPVPDHFYRLSEAASDNLVAQKAREYLWGRRIDPQSYPFYLSTGVTQSVQPKDINFAKLCANRVIIPSFRNEDLVYYIARSLDPNSKVRYLNAPAPKTNIIFGFDKLYADKDNCLFVLEGFFDAYHVEGVAVMENRMTAAQIELLNRSPRKKVVIPDNKGDSKKLAEQALSLGWGLSIPEIGHCKDISEGIEEYGKLYVLHSVMKNIQFGEAAKFSFNFR